MKGTQNCDIVISNSIYPTSCLKTLTQSLIACLKKSLSPVPRIETLKDGVYLVGRGEGGGLVGGKGKWSDGVSE